MVPRKIENPLRSGLPAKVYLQLYLDEETGYSLAKKIYNIEQGIPPTNKIYPWLKKMEEQGIIEKTPRGYKINIKPLVEEIGKELEQHTIILNTNEKKQLERILASTDFRRYVGGFYKRFESHVEVDFESKTVRKIRDFDALQLIGETVGIVSTTCFIKRKFGSNPISKYDEVQKQFSKVVKELKNSDHESMEDSVKLLDKVEQSFLMLDNDLLAKLSKLWAHSHNIIYSRYVEFHDEQTKEKKT